MDAIEVPRPGPLVVQLSDTHVGSRLAGRGVPAESVLRSALAAVTALEVPVDLLLLTGDLVDHGTPDEYGALFAVLDTWAGPVAVLPGNHDDPAVLRPLLAGRQPLADDVPGICFTVDVGPLRVMGLDSWDRGRDAGRLGAERLDWLDRQLAADARPTIVAVHHPPVPVGHALLDTMYLDDGDALGAVVERYPHVERVVCGHAHRAVSLRWRGTVVSVAPSAVRAFAPALAPELPIALSAEQPAFAVHAWVAGALTTHVVGFDPTAAGLTVAPIT